MLVGSFFPDQWLLSLLSGGKWSDSPSHSGVNYEGDAASDVCVLCDAQTGGPQVVRAC